MNPSIDIHRGEIRLTEIVEHAREGASRFSTYGGDIVKKHYHTWR